MLRSTESGAAYDLVRSRARTDGGRDALVDAADGTVVSYAALAERADSLAARLRGRGAARDEPVAVLLDRPADAITALLAVAAAGGAYCPLDTDMPDSRLAATLDRLGARLAVADAGHAARLPAGISVLSPEGPDEPGPEAGGGTGSEPGTAAHTEPDSEADPAQSSATAPSRDDLAYVLFTSGSTGVPKGVAMSRRGLDRLIAWQCADGPPGLRTLQFTATSFDVTFQEVLSTLAGGGTLVLVPESVRRDASALLDVIRDQRVQRLFLPYVALQLLASAAVRRSVFPASLEHVVTAGERLIITPAIRAFFEALPGCRLDNHYGPTEAHLVTAHTLAGPARDWPATPPIGAPVGGVVCRVLDERLAAVPEGDVGELYVAGTGLARGYLNDPALTAERFVADPFAAEPGARLYRTGDLVRAGSDGGYEFEGRADGQLKVRGFRVEPAEVVHALAAHPGVQAAAVALREIADGVPALVAYLQTDTPVGQREIAGHVRGLLPAYMVPSRYVSVPTMPRTASGKIDLRALAALELPEAADATPAGPDVTPADHGPADAAAPVPEPASLTDVIAALWTRVLGHDEFEHDEDFFDVGGDSLLATWVVAELGQALGRPVELSVLLEYSTVEDLAEALGSVAPRTAGKVSPSQIVTLRPGPSGRSLYLFHPLGGELICYRDLARASHAPVRILGVGWTGAPPPFGATLAEIARVHVEQLLVVQPDAPFLLAGWSFGGVLAYETARQLTAAGAKVDLLGLIDANPVIDPITGLALPETPFLGVLDEVAARLDDPATTGDDLAELTSGRTWLQLMGAPIAAGASTSYLRTALETARSCMAAAMRYRPEPHAGPIELFQAFGSGAERQAGLAAAIRGLGGGTFTASAVPGDHWTCIRAENAAETAKALDMALERAGAAGSGIDGS